jgi:hypothetical protein
MPPIDPKPVGDHPAAQRLARNGTTVQFRQLLGRECWTKVGVPLAHERQREAAHVARKPMIARFAAAVRQQARGAVLFEATQQTKHLTPMQTDQHAGILNPQAPRLNAQ